MLSHVRVVPSSVQIPSSLSSTGHIPTELCSKKNPLTGLFLGDNQLSGSIQVISLGANHLNGVVPEEFGKMTQLRTLYLGGNQLVSGSTTSLPILTSLTNCSTMRSIDLGKNNLMGRLPFSIGRFSTKMYYIQLNRNGLAGEIPPQIGNLSSLSFLALDSNSFTGAVPSSIKMLHNLERLYIGGNYLEGKIPTEIGQLKSLGLLASSFGKVYKGVLNDGTIIAVKLLNLENEGAQKSFDKECKVLGRVRHRNLIRIITSYSDLQIKVLIFPLMPNGSLEKWLYPDDKVESRLTLIRRLNIAIDIAQGMAYLHHHCFMQVIHCDLKPNNVLLGEDMTAYLIDFGIATICFAESEDLSLTSTHALKGSIGYIPPEYGLGGCVTTKGDVYSYGVVLLEMLTRNKPTHNMFVEGMNLQKWVGSGFPNQVREVVDKSLLRRTSTITEQDKELNCLNHLVNVGLLCTKESPEGRPTMINIVGMLQNIRDTFRDADIPNFKENITHLIGSTSTTCNIIGEGESSSTF